MPVSGYGQIEAQGLGTPSIKGLDTSRQPPLVRELDDPCPRRWKQAEGYCEQPDKRGKPAEGGLQESSQQRKKSESRQQQPSIDSYTIEREVVRQHAAQFLGRDGGRGR